MDSLTLRTTAYTRVSQARSFRVPGYLIVEPLRRVHSLEELTEAERADLLDVLAAAERWVRTLMEPERVYQLRFGESDGAVHFHVVPRTTQLLEGYLKSHAEDPPYSGARIVDWVWFHQGELGYTQAEVDEWVERARALAATEAELPVAWTRMADAATQYCRWIESLEAEPQAGPSAGADAERQRVTEARDLLLVIMGAATALEEVSPEDSEGDDDALDRLLKSGASDVIRRAAALPIEFYASNTYDDDRCGEAESPPTLGAISDDLSDIWRDLKSGLHRWENGQPQSAVWEWRFSFHSHWSLHAVDALREMQIYLVWA